MLASSSRSLASRAFATVLALVLAALFGTSACGRSNLDDYQLLGDGGTTDGPVADVDSGPHQDGGPCSAANCPTGCCDSTGTCQTGSAITQCGAGGEACQNCQAEGFALCDATRHACGNPVTSCSPATCSGCCEGNVCFAGVDPNECGGGGQACVHCANEGLACEGQQCVKPACGPGNCPGCCFGGECIGGTSSTACGQGGQQCVNCTAAGETCLATTGGGVCTGTPTCGPQNCNGCCQGNTCMSGVTSTACGFGGEQCVDCVNFGAACENQACVGQFCSPQNCSGCCLGTVCVQGTDPGACGFGGFQCTDCTQFGETCQNGGCFGQTTCSPQNCPGCCVGNVCMTGTSATECGFGGGTCQDCQALGEACGNGTCIGQASCGPQNCPGCCQGNQCQLGSSSFACGFGGAQCQNCLNFGETCSNDQCVTQPTCGPQNCKGCCFGTTCIDGMEDATCGFGGATCLNCSALGETCNGGQGCAAPQCGPQNCAGCCQGNTCVAGTLDFACGQAGQQCQNCAPFGETCQNQACVAPTTCGPQNCGGCCQGDVCMFGDATNACGFGGAQCQDCSMHGESCTNGQCMSACNQFNCAGCCDANQVCQPGFLDTQCGGQGGSCTDCTSLSPPTTCDGSVTPAACKGQETQCPSAYGGCFAPPTQPPFQQAVCSDADLQNARAACATGPYTTACFNYFNVEFQQNPACGSCLQPFDYDFADNQGVYACVAPFVDASCNQATACSSDCELQSCGTCPDLTTFTQCRSTVESGQCATYLQAAQCDQTALSGTASFCNPSQYGDYGAWLQAVGSHYCGMGNVVDAGAPTDAGFGGQ